MKILLILSIIIGIINAQNQNENLIIRNLNKQKRENNDLSNNKSSIATCDTKTCKLPLCKCADTQTPGNLDLNVIPMMIMITFNGIVQKEHAPYIKRILNPVFKNPNKCPVQGTFYVSEAGKAKTDYCLVQKLFNNNNEIGVGTPKYLCPYSDCESGGKIFHDWNEDAADTAIFEQKKSIARKGRINRSFLRGFRMPFLDNRKNVHYQALRKYAFNYDSSIIITKEDIRKQNGLRLWPHTLEYPVVTYSCKNCPTYKELCGNRNCSMESFWAVPMHYLDAEGTNPCPTLIPIPEPYPDRTPTQSCIKPDEITEKLLERILFDSFKRNYETNKAPFVLNIETLWFNKYGNALSNALVTFVNELTSENGNYSKNNDIYFVTVSKALDWIQYPVPLDILANKWLWDCDGVDFDYDQECDFVEQLVKNAEILEQIKANKTKNEMDLKGEDLYRNGVLSGVIAIFVLSIIFIILYDKYH